MNEKKSKKENLKEFMIVPTDTVNFEFRDKDGNLIRKGKSGEKNSSEK